MKTLVLVLSLAALMLLFAVNRWWRYPDIHADLPRLTSGHIADPRSSGATFRFEGRVTSVRMTPKRILVVRLHDPELDISVRGESPASTETVPAPAGQGAIRVHTGSMCPNRNAVRRDAGTVECRDDFCHGLIYLDVPVFPSLGPLPVKPVRGESVRVTGNLGSYGGLPQLRPLSAAHVLVLRTQESGQAVPLAQAALRKGERLRVGPVRAVRVEPFTSRRGRHHLRLTFTDPRAPERETVQGIIFQGDRTYREVELLRSGARIVVTADVDEYRGRPSLVVKRVVRAD